MGGCGLRLWRQGEQVRAGAGQSSGCWLRLEGFLAVSSHDTIFNSRVILHARRPQGDPGQSQGRVGTSQPPAGRGVPGAAVREVAAARCCRRAARCHVELRGRSRSHPAGGCGSPSRHLLRSRRGGGAAPPRAGKGRARVLPSGMNGLSAAASPRPAPPPIGMRVTGSKSLEIGTAQRTGSPPHPS